MIFDKNGKPLGIDGVIEDTMKIEFMDFVHTQAPDATFVKMPYNVFCVYVEQRIIKAEGCLEEYLTHKPSCEIEIGKAWALVIKDVGPRACTCGLQDALKRRF